jgi:hypothetical protein
MQQVDENIFTQQMFLIDKQHISQEKLKHRMPFKFFFSVK